MLGAISAIETAVHDGRFGVESEPIMDITKQTKLVGSEMLIRMYTPRGDRIMPSQFIPFAEEFDIIGDIDRWAITLAIAHVARYGECAFINLSASSVTDTALVDFIIATADHYKVPPALLVFEVTETAPIRCTATAASVLGQLRAIGSRTALDDFCTGHCAFANLLDLPIDYVKISGRHTCALGDQRVRNAVSFFAKTAHDHGKEVIGEFVRDWETANALGELGINLIQGELARTVHRAGPPNGSRPDYRGNFTSVTTARCVSR